MPYNSDSSNEDKFQDIDRISRVDVKIYYENEDMEEYRLINRFPEKWMEFGNLLMGLVGFDVLNIENLRYLISELHFDIKKEGVYLNGKKLSLTKLYYYRGGIYGSLCYNYSIDFVNKKINRPLYNHLDFPDEETVVNLTDDECFFYFKFN